MPRLERYSYPFRLWFWKVKLSVADPVKYEEALWLIDVALTVLRFAVPKQELGIMAPTVGQVEPHPVSSQTPQDQNVTIDKGGISLASNNAPNRYEFMASIGESVEEHENTKKIGLIFAGEAKSLSLRFSQGCGWISRGRRAQDRSNRLLFFFTALESLLSDSDQTSPVVQTIARNAAVLLTDEVKLRMKIAKDIRVLYSIRSALIHAGNRKASDEDSNTIQIIVEEVYMRVWEKIALSTSHTEFCLALGRASYGSPLDEEIAEF